MKRRFISIFILFLFFTVLSSMAQTTRRVLFLGNSYTAFNNLPQLVKDMALSAGDNLIFDSNTPGGYTLADHASNSVSLNKIRAGNWDYVVLQGQSQEPVVQNSAFNNGGNVLDDTIARYNPCGVTMLYVTWGRKNGDASSCPWYPEMCTYNSMDSALRQAYINLGNNLDGEISPVSIVWKYLRQNHPGIELYNADESHPSLAGSYAAACCFYTAIFKHDPTLITFNAGLNATDAAIIRNAAKTEVFDHLNDWDYYESPLSTFQYSIGSGTNEVLFVPNLSVSQTYFWDFGDGFNSTLPIVSHSYATAGTYLVTLTTTNCDLNGLHISISDTMIQFCTHTPTITTTHAWLCETDTLFTQPADSYQWYSGGLPIPVTTQYLPNFGQYLSPGFSVKSIVGGCAELSQVYNANTEWSGYYFDAAWGGDPCAGDTALLIVLHTSSSLMGTEIIRWYKNDTLLSFANDQDTLFITTEGSYSCKVINPASTCPFDTTECPAIVWDCDIAGLDEIDQEIKWNIYPNPASEDITIEFTNTTNIQQVFIYDISGRLIKTIDGTSVMHLNVSEWATGLYYIRLAGTQQKAFKLIKQ